MSYRHAEERPKHDPILLRCVVPAQKTQQPESPSQPTKTRSQQKNQQKSQIHFTFIDQSQIIHIHMFTQIKDHNFIRSRKLEITTSHKSERDGELRKKLATTPRNSKWAYRGVLTGLGDCALGPDQILKLLFERPRWRIPCSLREENHDCQGSKAWRWEESDTRWLGNLEGNGGGANSYRQGSIA